MPTFNIYIPLVFLFFIITFPSLKTEAAPEYRSHFCPNTSTYSPNSTYQSNLNLVLSSFSSNATNGNGFYNVTAGRGSQDTVYGLFLCRGDVTADVCQDCVATATSEIVSQKYCPKEKTAIIWYDLCMLRYDNESFFSVMEYSPSVAMYNVQNVTEQSRLNQIVYDTMNNISTRAASNQSGKKFATDEANFTAPYNNIYNLVQCTPDISAADCNRCLQTAVAALPNCCSGKQGGNVLLPSCNIRYEVYQFYSVLAAAPAPSPPAPTRSTPPVPISPSSSSNTVPASHFLATQVSGGCTFLDREYVVSMIHDWAVQVRSEREHQYQANKLQSNLPRHLMPHQCTGMPDYPLEQAIDQFAIHLRAAAIHEI